MTQPTMLEGMERKSFSEMHCCVAQWLEVVGEWRSMLIVRDALLGVSRFDRFQEPIGARDVRSVPGPDALEAFVGTA